MTTALTTYGLSLASTTLTSAATLASTTGGVTATKDTKAPVAPATGYSELFGLGTTNAWSGAGSIGSASGNGWLWDVTTLEGQQIVSGNWTPTVRLQIAGGGTPSLTADIHVRAFVRSSGGTYTQIGSNMTKTGQTINSTATNYAFTATSLPVQNFITGSPGDKLYLDMWLNVTASSGTTSANNVRVSLSSTSAAGITNNFSTVTPGYQAITNNAMSSEDDLVGTDIGGSLLMWGIEALSLGETFLGTRSAFSSDGLSPLDVGGSLLAWSGESLVGGDALLEVGVWSRSDGLAGVDSFSGSGAIPLASESLSASDTLLSLTISNVSDSPGVTDSLIGSGGTSFSLDNVSANNPLLTFGMPAALDALLPLDTILVQSEVFSAEPGSVLDTAIVGSSASPSDGLQGSDTLATILVSLAQDILSPGDLLVMVEFPASTLIFTDQLMMVDLSLLQRERIPISPETVVSPFSDDRMVYTPLFANQPSI